MHTRHSRLTALASLLLMLLIPVLVQAQALDFSKFKSLKMRNLGPAGMSGRVTSIAGSNEVNPVLYVGTASGGVWKSENLGTSWSPIFDNEVIQSIGAVAVAPSNASIVWAGTGEGNPRNSMNSGKGIYRSLDAGRTWKCMGLEQTFAIHRIVIDPQNPEVVYAAALGSAWGSSNARGVYKTTDGGTTWERSLYINDSTGCADLIIDPKNPLKLIAAMWEHHREPWFFTSGGRGSGLYMTIDGGKSWQRQDEKNGLPAGTLGRIGLGISASQPNIVYALVEARPTGLYRSDDGGYTWKKRADSGIGNRPFYYADFYVDPQNENRIFNLWSAVSMSEDGGKTFSTLLNYNEVHPDHQAWWIDPHNPNFMIDGNDGGMSITRDRGKTWAFVANLPVGQFYHVDYDMARPYNVMGGLQDNGSWIGPSQVWAHGGMRNYHWRELLYGDGFDVAAKRNDSSIVYAMSQGGALNRVHKETGEVIDIRPVHPTAQRLRFNWNAPLALDPFDDNGLYFGSQFLHQSLDGGNSWRIISPDLSTNDSTKQQQHKSGGLTLDATAAENYTTILSIAPSPLQKELIWVGTDDGNLQMTRDGGKNWENITDRLPEFPKGAWIPQIHASSLNAGEVFVVVNDYRRNHWDPWAYHSRDFGKTWRRIVKADQVAGHCLSILQDPVQENLLFLGTDQGLWISIDEGNQWTQWKRDFPSVPVSDMKIHPREHDLIVSTFGRGIWIMDDMRPLRLLAAEGTKLLEKDWVLLPVIPAVEAEFRSVDGVRFNGAADFGSANPGRGSEIVVYVRRPGPRQIGKEKEAARQREERKAKGEAPQENVEEPKKPDPKDSEFRLYILSLAGDTLRHLTAKADTGFQVIRWDHFRDGVAPPQYQKPPREYPRGILVPPGNYKLLTVYQGSKDSTEIVVLPDPRKKLSKEGLDVREQTYASFMRYAQAANDGFEQLREARNMVDRYEKMLDNLADNQRDSLKKFAKPVRDSIKNLMEIYLNPEDLKGLDHMTVRLADQYYVTGGRLDPMEAPSQNALLELKNFEQAVRNALARINHFLEKDWLAYRKTMENAQVPNFKDLPTIRLD